MSADLIRYRDINNVTILVNPDHIVAAVLNRQSYEHDWELTVTLTSGDQIKLMDKDSERLIAHARFGVHATR